MAQRWGERFAALLAIALPVLAGLAYMATGEAPQHYLIVNGASRSQIEVVSYGEERPAMTGQSESVYNRNRRVEVVAR